VKAITPAPPLSAGTAPPDPLLNRLAANEGVLVGVRDLLTKAVQSDLRITPAGEWLLDNFYLIEEQIRTAKRHLPKGYSRELPRLLNGHRLGFHGCMTLRWRRSRTATDGWIRKVSRFVAAYQTVTALKLGELWAIPIMLRLALIENLRRVAAGTAAHRIDRNQAGFWTD
jgi:cyclic beta-1,2-glucan glucanotransferase